MIPRRAHHGMTGSVLIVTPDAKAHATAAKALQAHGFSVVVETDMDAGLAHCAEADLVLLDAQPTSPETIAALCREWKSDRLLRDIPLILMTPNPVDPGMLAAGASDCLTQPLHLEDLLLRTDLHMNMRKMQMLIRQQQKELQESGERLASANDELQSLQKQMHAMQAELEERKRIEISLRGSEQRLRTLAEHLPDVIVRYDLDCRRVFVNPAYYRETGVIYGQAQGKTPKEMWRPINVSADDYQQRLQQVMQTGVADDIFLEYPGPDGRMITNALRMVAEYGPDGAVSGVLTIGRNISAIRRQENLEQARLRIFERLAQGAMLDEVLELVTRYVEQSHPEFLSSIMLADADGKHLCSGAAPSLPADYLAAIDGIAIAEGVGSCGTAAHRGKTVIVEDVRSHPLWADYKHLALRAGLVACWSEPILDSTGKVLGTFGIYLRHAGHPTEQEMEMVRQVSHLAAIAIERKRAEELLWESERKYRTLVEDSPDLIIRYDGDCRRVYVSDAYQQLHGRPAAAVLGKRPTEDWCSASMSAVEFERQLRQVMDTGKRIEIQLEWTTPEGEYFCHSMRAVPEYGREGRIVSVLSITRDVSEAKRAERSLHLHEQEIRSLVENTPDTIARYDRSCRLTYANPRMLEDLGASPEAVVGKTPSELPGGDSSAAYQERIANVFANGKSEDFELAWQSGDGKQIVSYIRLTPEFGVDGTVASVLAVGRDITEIDEYRQSIHHLAFYDTLTELPNRALLADRIQQTIADASWHDYQFGLIMLDLDRFKEVNDTLGHGVGDLLLREGASRLLDCVRSYDTVARLGGDEFAILLPQVREGEDLAVIARKIIEAFQQPFHIAGKELFISASMGIALYPSDSSEIDALFKYADSAMYHAKKRGRNNFQFYAKELTVRSAERMALEAALRKATKNDELEMYYQPQVALASGRVVGAEALLRWRQAGTLVTPERFIPVAEETGMIVSLGEWALLAACRAAVEWNHRLKMPFRVAVNLSTRQFIQNDLVASVRRILQETQCRPQWLKLEITESLLLEDSVDTLDILRAFDELGLSIAIDDFGTGYSALSYLNRFPVSQIKIDRSFVHGIPDKQDQAELVKAMISIAQALHLELVAEGVETREQADYLNTHGCLVGQGYLFGKPMPLAAFSAYLASN